MTMIVCYAKCSPCQFGQHDPTPHTWMDSDDLDHEGTHPSSPEEWAQLVIDRPCGCHCQKRGAS